MVDAQTFPPLVAPPAPSASTSPTCGKGLVVSARAARARGTVTVQTVTLSLHAGAPCLVSGFADIAFAGHAKTPSLRTGRLSNPSSALLDPQTQATFVVRYIRAPGALAAGCGLMIVIGGSDLGAGMQRAVIAVQNRSLTSCTMPGAMRAQLLGPQGRLMAVTVVASERRNVGDLPVRAGHEASLTLSFATTDPHGKTCPQSHAVALVFPNGTFTASAPTTLAPCPGPDGVAIRETPLRSGVPLAGFE